ncbi:MAG: AAA family ATPase [Actinomycetes bacterium]
MSEPTVHLMVGLNGAGKTTHARRLERQCPAVRFTLDEWMLRLHGLPFDAPEYPELSERCQSVIWDVALQVLATGTDVVLDWNLWSRARRATWRDRVTAAGYHPVLHHVQVPLDLAIRRAEERARRQVDGAHVLTVSDVRHLARIFETPGPGEGMELRVVGA